MKRDFDSANAQGMLTDKTIAEDLLTGQKYLSNYYYAPAVLESMDSELRNTFQQIHTDVQKDAQHVFEYLNAKGWYEPKQADPQAVNDLKNTARESQQLLSVISDETQNTGGKSTLISGQNPFSGQSGAGQGQFGYQQSGSNWQSSPQSFQSGSAWQPSHNQGSQWTGMQAGEGQSGMGPSSLAQWSHWGGQPSIMQGGGASHFYGGGSLQGHNTGGWQTQPQNYQAGTGWQPTYSSPERWTGTQLQEGHSGLGPSSVAQWTSWGGQPSFMRSGEIGSNYYGGTFGSQSSQGIGGWQSQPQRQQQQVGTGWQPTYSSPQNWTGTQLPEGQSGLGPSSLGHLARWGGQPSWMQGSQGGNVQTGQWS